MGDINVDSIENKIKRMFSPIEMPENPAERTYFPVPDNDEPLIAVAKDKEQNIPIIYLSTSMKLSNRKKRATWTTWSTAT